MILRFNAGDVSVGLGRLQGKLAAIAHIADHASPLMQRWERVIEEDNRKGVLAGTDKDGNPPGRPLIYRPRGKGVKLTIAQRLGQSPNKRRGIYMGRGPAASGLHNNLTTSEYRKLTGPRLAPRRQFSRIITNLETGHGRDPANPRVWFAEGVWREVVTPKGRGFLRYHFDGEGQLRYDLRGVRPEGRRLLLDALHEWAKLEIRERFTAG